MRHRKKINHLGRTSSHRKALLANMSISLIMHKRIRTTVAKAKALRMYVEPLINRSKEDTTHSRRIVFSYLQNKEAITELFREISQKVSNRPGGYTRILKLGPRFGDAAEMCYIELVDYNENMLKASASDDKKKTTRRSRRKSADDKAKATIETPKPKKISEQPVNAVEETPAITEIVEENQIENVEENSVENVVENSVENAEEINVENVEEINVENVEESNVESVKD